MTVPSSIPCRRRSVRTVILLTGLLLSIASHTASAEPSLQPVNIAPTPWGTAIRATSQFSPQHGAYNLVDGSTETGHGWLSQDHAPLPQQLTFTFEKEMALTQVRVAQAQWNPGMYRTRDFTLEISPDGERWTPLETGRLSADAGAVAEFQFAPVAARALRLTVTGSDNPVQTCGLGEVEIFALLPAGATPPYAGATPTIQWDALRGHCALTLNLDPPAPVWRPAPVQQAASREYFSNGYRLTLHEEKRSDRCVVVRYSLNRTDAAPFKVLNSQFECKTSYAGVYKIFTPSTMSQQTYKIDLPFRLEGQASGLDNTPVVWMQQTDGSNTLTIGMIDQLPATRIEGSTYDTSNGGEAQGIANSYVRTTLHRSGTGPQAVTQWGDGVYINDDPSLTWFTALLDYAEAVDTARQFQSRPTGANALNAMWHSWYAHEAEIDEALLREDARLAAALGVKTIEIDAGWNMIGYRLEEEGLHEFLPERFPDPRGMIDAMHAQGLKVILHVTPLLMGSLSKAYPEMKDCVVKVNGKEDVHLDPRYQKSLDYLLKAWEKLFVEYGVDGLWYDFLEVPAGDPPTPGMALLSPNMEEAYTLLMQRLYQRALELNPDAVIILRRGSANLNAKTYSTHVWPMDTPQDYNMNRRDIVYLKTYGEGVLTHACCTSWAISESDENVARQMASVVLAGVPAFSVKLAESPAGHNAIIKAWLTFYEPNQHDLVLGRMTPLLPTPPSAALRIEAPAQAFFGFFEAMPGLIELTRPVDRITIVNAFSNRTATRLEGVTGAFKAEVFNQSWERVEERIVQAENGGLTLDFSGPTRCFSIVLTRP